MGAVIDAPVPAGVEVLNTAGGWYRAIDSSGATRERHLGLPNPPNLGSVEMVNRQTFSTPAHR
ncbi:hypothetical protein AWC11_27360 [Mycobacterium interjectum]|nr:hypothetical protein AWC11_27360 [Mycobacterium interjectum]